MRIIKEYCPTATRCAVRTDTYASSLRHMLNLFREAKSDFPNLKESETEIVHYGGRRFSGTFGIEFNPGGTAVPKAYARISRLEKKR